MSDGGLIPRAPRCRCRVLPEDVEGEAAGTETETEWAVRWDEDGGIVWYGIGDNGRAEAVGVARRYDYGTPESRVSVVCRTVIYGPWASEQP